MGIQGLKSLIEKNRDKLLTPAKLHDTKVIIDGNNLCPALYNMYNLDQRHGGNYDELAACTKEFFGVLKKCNIEPYVLLDGGSNTGRKLDTIKRRASDGIQRCSNVAKGVPQEGDKILPLLSKEELRYILCELNIKYIKCPFEADPQIAALANKWDCLVISNDYDFRIFDLNKGVITFNDLRIAEVGKFPNGHVKAGQSFVPVDVYDVGNLLKHFPNLDKPMLPVFASLYGNDIVKTMQLKDFYHVYSRVDVKNSTLECTEKNEIRIVKLLLWLNNLCSKPPFSTSPNSIIEEALSYIHDVDQRNEVQQKIEQSMKFYQLQDVSDLSAAFEPEWDPYESETEFKQLEALNIPKWLAKRISKDAIGTFLINALCTQTVPEQKIFLKRQVEDLDQPSPHTCSRKIRQTMYCMMFKDIEDKPRYICECDRSVRKGGKCQIEEDHVSLNAIDFPSLAEIPNMKKKDISQLMFHALGLDPFDQSESDMHLALIAMRFWRENSVLNIDNLHIYTLLLCMIKLALDSSSEIFGHQVSDSQTARQKLRDFCQKASQRAFDITVLHSFAEFQSILKALMNLNEFLQCPAKPVRPSQIFNGVFLHNTFCELQSHDDPKSHICEILAGAADLFTQLVVKVGEESGTGKWCTQQGRKGRKGRKPFRQ